MSRISLNQPLPAQPGSPPIRTPRSRRWLPTSPEHRRWSSLSPTADPHPTTSPPSYFEPHCEIKELCRRQPARQRKEERKPPAKPSEHSPRSAGDLSPPPPQAPLHAHPGVPDKVGQRPRHPVHEERLAKELHGPGKQPRTGQQLDRRLDNKTLEHNPHRQVRLEHLDHRRMRTGVRFRRPRKAELQEPQRTPRDPARPPLPCPLGGNINSNS